MLPLYHHGPLSLHVAYFLVTSANKDMFWAVFVCNYSIIYKCTFIKNFMWTGPDQKTKEKKIMKFLGIHHYLSTVFSDLGCVFEINP